MVSFGILRKKGFDTGGYRLRICVEKCITYARSIRVGTRQNLRKFFLRKKNSRKMFFPDFLTSQHCWWAKFQKTVNIKNVLKDLGNVLLVDNFSWNLTVRKLYAIYWKHPPGIYAKLSVCTIWSAYIVKSCISHEPS